MTEHYLLPEDVRAIDAKMVLDFLNAATSAEEIATAVEIPDERDIGLKVAARILARRDQLGGFTTLEQVYAVPYVGPERFTELVVTLSTARPPRVTDSGASLADIKERLLRLESQTSSGPTIHLDTINNDVLLGQDVHLTAELRDGQGNPMINREVTFMTTWGLLNGRSGLNPVYGNSITLQTDHLGLCRLRLTASLGEALTQVETASLNRALSQIGPLENTPRDNVTELMELARLYRDPGSDSLRRAIDVYFKRYGDSSRIDGPADSLSHWPYFNVTVIACLTPDSPAAQVPSTLLNIRQRNWFYAWLWAYRKLLEEQSTLVASFASVNGGERSASGVLSDIFSRVGTFMHAQNGIVGRHIGQQFAANSLNNFIQVGLTNFSSKERAKVLTGVTSGVKSLDSTQAFSSFQVSRVSTNQQIDASIATVDTSSQLSGLDSRVTELESSTITMSDFDVLRGEILSAASQTTTTLIQEFESTFTNQLDTKASVTSVNELADTVNTRLNGKADNTRIVNLEQQVSALDNQTKSLDSNMRNMNTNLNLRIDGLQR